MMLVQPHPRDLILPLGLVMLVVLVVACLSPSVDTVQSTSCIRKIVDAKPGLEVSLPVSVMYKEN
ncbi:hypothetical protein I7I50_05187 [Histoplasma capsulatum G186AR]|uniref:Uncharacterized protein n=1 Tax=Ajellomyces capsulatus TaxID=5037 RepID=A0A8H8D8I3_AJECA|nr:hypothetical protein I7I52_03445 [Histoplasma capsulatum]QSS75898.1 hypothetical protein I7I50_05187 [Histoplasma capsulatum G186AR]